MTLRCLFVDFNAYFASVEQEDDPSLRDRPVVVVPVMAATTCCIAASYAAKAHGIKTGTPVWEALERCPDVAVVQARPARYIELHHRLMQAIEDCIPHGKAESIDEVPCWLLGRERQPANAVAIAERIKRRIADEFSFIRCSIGIAPNKFLAKTASDMHKPDGLTVIEQADLPHALHRLELRDLCGIGPSMQRRLLAAGIHDVATLCAAPRERLRAAWKSIEGERFWMQLRGHELPERKTRRSSIGHSHVLGPELRNVDGMRSVLFKLLAKAAMRLRREGLVAEGLQMHVRFVGLEERHERAIEFDALSDTPSLMHLLATLVEPLCDAAGQGDWQPDRHPPLAVAVTLAPVADSGDTNASLLPVDARARQVTDALDHINRKFGLNALHFGSMQLAIGQEAAPMRIPFSTIPEASGEDESSALPNSHAEELMRLRERQFKVLAESAHREARKRGVSPGKRLSTPQGESSAVADRSLF
jgi:DNA polymerase-4